MLASSIRALLGAECSGAVPSPAPSPAALASRTAAELDRRVLTAIGAAALAGLLVGVVSLVSMTGGGDGDTATVTGDPASLRLLARARTDRRIGFKTPSEGGRTGAVAVAMGERLNGRTRPKRLES